jgi:hypothetical protein
VIEEFDVVEYIRDSVDVSLNGEFDLDSECEEDQEDDDDFESY